MKKFALVPVALLFAATASHAFFDCQDKRFSREMEYLLMSECMGGGSTYYRNETQQQEKLKACVCYVGSLACEYKGKDEKLNKAAEKGELKKDEKSYQSCLEDQQKQK